MRTKYATGGSVRCAVMFMALNMTLKHKSITIRNGQWVEKTKQILYEPHDYHISVCILTAGQ